MFKTGDTHSMTMLESSDRESVKQTLKSMKNNIGSTDTLADAYLTLVGLTPLQTFRLIETTKIEDPMNDVVKIRNTYEVIDLEYPREAPNDTERKRAQKPYWSSRRTMQISESILISIDKGMEKDMACMSVAIFENGTCTVIRTEYGDAAIELEKNILLLLKGDEKNEIKSN